MNSTIPALIALVGYLIAYFTYGKYIGKRIFGISVLIILLTGWLALSSIAALARK